MGFDSAAREGTIGSCGGRAVLGLVIGLAAAVALVGAVAWFVLLRGGPGARAARRRIAVVRRSLRTAEKSHERAVRDAQRLLGSAENERAKAIKAAERHLANLQSPTGRRIKGFGGMTLFERFIRTPHGAGSVVGAHAAVDTAGNLAVKSRATLTRMAAGGVLLGPLGAILSLGFKKHKAIDTRELYLLVETPEFASVIKCNPDKGAQARNFAALINTAAAQAAIAESKRPQAIADARTRLESIHADTSTVDAARRGLAQAEADSEGLRAIDAARTGLEAAISARRADGGPGDSRRMQPS